MAATTTAFEAEILALPTADSRARGLMAGPAYKLRDAYLRGITDPTAHNLANNNPRQVKAIGDNGKTASFAAITGP